MGLRRVGGVTLECRFSLVGSKHRDRYRSLGRRFALAEPHFATLLVITDLDGVARLQAIAENLLGEPRFQFLANLTLKIGASNRT